MSFKLLSLFPCDEVEAQRGEISILRLKRGIAGLESRATNLLLTATPCCPLVLTRLRCPFGLSPSRPSLCSRAVLKCPGDPGILYPVTSPRVFYCVLLCPGCGHSLCLQTCLNTTENLFYGTFRQPKAKIQKAPPHASPEAKKSRAESLFEWGEKRKEKTQRKKNLNYNCKHLYYHQIAEHSAVSDLLGSAFQDSGFSCGNADKGGVKTFMRSESRSQL